MTCSVFHRQSVWRSLIDALSASTFGGILHLPCPHAKWGLIILAERNYCDEDAGCEWKRKVRVLKWRGDFGLSWVSGDARRTLLNWNAPIKHWLYVCVSAALRRLGGVGMISKDSHMWSRAIEETLCSTLALRNVVRYLRSLDRVLRRGCRLDIAVKSRLSC